MLTARVLRVFNTCQCTEPEDILKMSSCFNSFSPRTVLPSVLHWRHLQNASWGCIAGNITEEVPACSMPNSLHTLAADS